MINKVALWLKKALDGVTEIGHALVSLVMFWAFLPFLGLSAAITGPICGYFFQEVRDETNKILKQKRGTYWTAWIKAVKPAVLSKDFLYPVIAVAASALIYSHFLS